MLLMLSIEYLRLLARVLLQRIISWRQCHCRIGVLKGYLGGELFMPMTDVIASVASRLRRSALRPISMRLP